MAVLRVEFRSRIMKKTLSFLILFALNVSFAGEDFSGGVGTLCCIFSAAPVNDTGGKNGYRCYKTNTRWEDKDYVSRITGKVYYTRWHPGPPIFGGGSSAGFIPRLRTDRWVCHPDTGGCYKFIAETNCQVRWLFYPSGPPTGDKYWFEIVLFVNGKQKRLSESDLTIYMEEKNNFLPKVSKKVLVTYRLPSGRKRTEYRNQRVAREIKYIPRPTQDGGIVINSARRLYFTRTLKKGESVSLNWKIKAAAEIEYK